MQVTYHFWLEYAGDRPGEVLEALAVAARRRAASARVNDPVYLDAQTVASIFADDLEGTPSQDRHGPDGAVRSAVRAGIRFVSSEGDGDVVGSAEFPFDTQLPLGGRRNIVVPPIDLWVVTCIPHPGAKQTNLGLARYPTHVAGAPTIGAGRSVATGLGGGWRWYGQARAGPKYKQVLAVIAAGLTGAAEAGARTNMLRM